MSSLCVAGVLSGTSVDGIDVAIVRISKGQEKGSVNVEQLFFDTYPFDPELRLVQALLRSRCRKQILQLCSGPTTSQQICKANFNIGKAFGEAVNLALKAASMSKDQLDLVASHGQTIWHEVVGKEVHSTLQIGESAVISEITGITCVSDFRVADVAAGGQGAPVTSIFDYTVLRPKPGAGWRAIQNIGGISNVTFVPPLGDDSPPIAFDNGPGNVLLDWFISYVTDDKKKFDEDGEFASSGNINSELLDLMLELPYFRLLPPKTTGRELFTAALGKQWVAAAKEKGISDESIMATLAELTAITIVDSYYKYCPQNCKITDAVISGGGTKNKFLMSRIGHHLRTKLGPDTKITTHEALGIDSKAKEGQVFALLGWMCISQIPASLPSCTGARGERIILGKITPGTNFSRLFPVCTK